MKFSSESSLTSRNLSRDSLFKELSLVLQAKFSFMFGVFRIIHQQPKFHLNLVCKLTKSAIMG